MEDAPSTFPVNVGLGKPEGFSLLLQTPAPKLSLSNGTMGESGGPCLQLPTTTPGCREVETLPEADMKEQP